MIDRHTLSIAARAAAGLLAVVLLVHHWNALPGDLYLSAALLMGLGLVLLSDPLLDDAGLRLRRVVRNRDRDPALSPPSGASVKTHRGRRRAGQAWGAPTPGSASGST